MKLNTDGAIGEDVMCTLNDIVGYLAMQSDADAFRLSYIDNDDHCCRISNNDALYEAAENKEDGVLYVKVTSNDDVTDDEVDFVWWNKEKALSVKNLAKRFSVHQIPCYNCEKGCIVGVRYVFKDNNDYSVCDECIDSYNNLCYAKPYPWKEPVPNTPLSVANWEPSEEVKHLQQILTWRRYMTMDATAEWQGSYRQHTAEAVKAYRTKHGLEGGDMTVYNDKMMQHLKKVMQRNK